MYNAQINKQYISSQAMNYDTIIRDTHRLYTDAVCRFHQIDAQLKFIEQKLQNLPQDGFACHINGRNCKWYRVTLETESVAENMEVTADESSPERKSASSSGEGSHRRTRHHYEYIPRSDEKLARQLALRRYLICLTKDLQNERQALELFTNRLDRDCRNAEKFLISAGIEPLIGEELDAAHTKARSWQSEPYDRSTDRLEGLTVPTIGGFNVRSKSEALIANILLEREIPFRYEYVQIIDQRRYTPDFTILHPDTGQIVIWEHFGMMNDITYRNDYLTKIGRYISAGLIPYENLITTYESGEVPFSAEKANRIVKLMFDR